MDWRRGCRELADMVWPRKCTVCGEFLETDEKFVCRSCLADMPRTYFWSWRDNPAERILWARTCFRSVVCLFYYSRDNGYRRLLYSLKYHGNIALARWLGRMLGAYMRSSGHMQPEYIVPVPLHWRRKWRRGYNQAEAIARGISEGLAGESGKQVPVLAGVLRRVRYSTSQTRMSVGCKWENVSGAFVLKDPGRASKLLAGRYVLLVDDVLTTGATAEACWDALKAVPDIKMSYASIAYVAGRQ